MYKCKYCGRYLKTNYDNCPGCGSNSFEHTDRNGVMRITKVPEGGYKINISNLKKDNIGGILLLIIGIVFILMSSIFSIVLLFAGLMFKKAGLNEFPGIGSLLMDIPFILIGVGMIIGGVKMTKNHRKKIEKVKELTQHGVLIKNLPYKVKETGTIVNDKPVYCIEVMYEYENGTSVPLRSEGKYDGKLSRGDGTVDLLIDPNDSNNYFIDFEIY